MGENLKANNREYENAERKDRLEKMDSTLKNLEDLVIEEALRNPTTEDDPGLQKV